MDEIVEHQGRILKIHENLIEVEIIPKSMCASCNVAGYCSVSNVETKIIEIPVQNSSEFSIGQIVDVYLTEDLALKAVFWAYGMPLIVLVLSLFISYFLLKNDLHAGLLAIAITGVYYIILSFFRKKLAKVYKFKIK